MNKKLWLITAVIVTASVVVYIWIVFPSERWIMRKAITKNDETVCNKIKQSEFGDLFTRYFCVAGV